MLLSVLGSWSLGLAVLGRAHAPGLVEFLLSCLVHLCRRHFARRFVSATACVRSNVNLARVRARVQHMQERLRCRTYARRARVVRACRACAARACSCAGRRAASVAVAERTGGRTLSFCTCLGGVFCPRFVHLPLLGLTSTFPFRFVPFTLGEILGVRRTVPIHATVHALITKDCSACCYQPVRACTPRACLPTACVSAHRVRVCRPRVCLPSQLRSHTVW